jgi:hypothetical protein
MTVNWGAVGITMGLILVAVSILAVGFMVERRLTVRLTTLEKEVPFIRAGIKRKIIAQGYAFRKAESQKRPITLEDLKEGYALADKFMGK